MRFRILFGIALASSFVVPIVANAASIPFFGPIIDPSWTVSSTGTQCALGWGAVITVINNLIRLLITIIVVFVAPLMIAWSGFLYVVNPVDPSGIAKAKNILTSTVFGIIIALAGWLVVDAIMAVLYHPTDPGLAGRTWSSLITSGNALTCIPQEGIGTGLNQSVNGAPSPGVVVTPAPTGQLTNGFATGCSTSNDQNVTILTSSGVSGHSTNNCCVKTQSTCTSLDGMLPSTVQQIINIQQACGSVVVTGGTEVGHASEGGTTSHSGGAKVDIATNLISCVLRNGGTRVASPTFGSEQAKGSCGNIYTWEGNHTDVYVVQNCTL